VYRTAEQHLARLLNSGQQGLLKGGKLGLEKETLRVNRRGGVAQTPHSAALGSALTHPHITTDYSEALAEFITPPFTDVRACLEFLRDTQKFVYANLDNELLWAASMPCIVAGETSIPIAYYGTSNIGIMKNIYRRGLGYRYGRVMQVHGHDPQLATLRLVDSLPVWRVAGRV
jgi:glutamate--cysteine ligase